MPPIDINNLSYHVRADRKERLAQIKSVGIGFSIAEKEEIKNGRKVMKTLTSTGIMVIRAVENNMIITMYLADFDQAEKFFRKQYGLKLPHDIGDKIKLNNIMFPAN